MEVILKTAYIIVGPESSGTRLLTKILIKAGCAGSPGHSQKWDTKPFAGNSIVLSRSYAHSSMWPSLKSIVSRCSKEGYRYKIIVINRDWLAMAKSQVHRKHCKNETQAFLNIRKAYTSIYQDIDLSTDYIVISYESLVQRPVAVLKYLAKFTKLDIDYNYKIVDQNKKWLS